MNHMNSPKIYTVTLNPSLDRTLSIHTYKPGSIHHAELLRVDLGGKGINVTRALRNLGIESEIITVLAGSTGQILKNGLNSEG